MDHLCHRCRATVEDGVPFCPHCGAPQIRVAGVTVPEEAATPAFPPGTQEEVAPPAEPVRLEPHGVQWSHGLRAAALAGLLLAICLIFVPGRVASVGVALRLGQSGLGLLLMTVSWCCIAAGGAMAVIFYRRRQPDTLITSGIGARLGAVTGLLAFFIWGIPLILLIVLQQGGSVADLIRKAIQQAAAQNPDPTAQELMSNLLSPGWLALFITFMVMMVFLIFLVFGTLGGALGASLWGSKKPS